MSEKEFAAQISKGGGDEAAAFLIHCKLQDWIYAQGFTPYPEDHLGRLYGIAEEELDEDMILDILRQSGASPPSAERLATFGVVDTPLRVAQLVACAKAETAPR